MLDDPGHVKSQIISVVCQIQQFDFDCNLAVTRKVIIQIPPPLRSNLYRDNGSLAEERSPYFAPHDSDPLAPPSGLTKPFCTPLALMLGASGDQQETFVEQRLA